MKWILVILIFIIAGLIGYPFGYCIGGLQNNEENIAQHHVTLSFLLKQNEEIQDRLRYMETKVIELEQEYLSE